MWDTGCHVTIRPFGMLFKHCLGNHLALQKILNKKKMGILVKNFIGNRTQYFVLFHEKLYTAIVQA